MASNETVFRMRFGKIYRLLLDKAVKKGRTEEEVHQVTAWLTGYSPEFLVQAMDTDLTYGDFFRQAPHPHPTREKIKGQNFFRIIFYIPNILSVVVISGIFSAIYKPENGMLNSIIGLFRNMSDPILWKGEKLIIPSIIIAMVWQFSGYVAVIFLAAIKNVPTNIINAAKLDGA